MCIIRTLHDDGAYVIYPWVVTKCCCLNTPHRCGDRGTYFVQLGRGRIGKYFVSKTVGRRDAEVSVLPSLEHLPCFRAVVSGFRLLKRNRSGVAEPDV
jgi:hypothetical protein